MRGIMVRTVAAGVLLVSMTVLWAVSWLLAETLAAETHRIWPRGTTALFVDPVRFGDLVLVGALALLVGTVGWLTVAVSLTAATDALRCGHTVVGGMARRVTPRLCSTLVRAACGAAVLTVPTTAMPAFAMPPQDPPPDAAGCASGHCSGRQLGLARLPVPDRPTTPPLRTADVATRAVPEAGTTSLEVRRGDTLWSIAARHLPPGTTDAEIAAAWPVWFDANRARLGPDPHLIHPRTRLVLPERFRPDDKDRR
ncbi:MAG: LysM peptidoglycan-binding domain-containing protein [Nocardioidaceae bacterium]